MKNRVGESKREYLRGRKERIRWFISRSNGRVRGLSIRVRLSKPMRKNRTRSKARTLNFDPRVPFVSSIGCHRHARRVRKLIDRRVDLELICIARKENKRVPGTGRETKLTDLFIWIRKTDTFIYKTCLRETFYFVLLIYLIHRVRWKKKIVHCRRGSSRPLLFLRFPLCDFSHRSSTGIWPVKNMLSPFVCVFVPPPRHTRLGIDLSFAKQLSHAWTLFLPIPSSRWNTLLASRVQRCAASVPREIWNALSSFVTLRQCKRCNRPTTWQW